MKRDRRGFALLAVLWVLVGMSALALAGALGGRRAVDAASNRRLLAVGRWRAEGCVERARAAIAEALADDAARTSRGAPTAWRMIDSVVVLSPYVVAGECDVTLRAAGSALDINSADDAMLRALFVAAGVRHVRADSMTDALLDWRDADELPRARGAERAWYRAQRLAVPRDGPIADVRELARVRGFVPDGDSAIGWGLDTLLDVERGRVVLARAAPAVLAALPGMTPEAVARIAELRMRGAVPADLLTLTGALSPAARDSLVTHYQELVPLVTTDPDAWTLTARGTAANGGPTAVVEVRLVRAGPRAAIVRRRGRV